MTGCLLVESAGQADPGHRSSLPIAGGVGVGVSPRLAMHAHAVACTRTGRLMALGLVSKAAFVEHPVLPQEHVPSQQSSWEWAGSTQVA